MVFFVASFTPGKRKESDQGHLHKSRKQNVKHATIHIAKRYIYSRYIRSSPSLEENKKKRKRGFFKQQVRGNGLKGSATSPKSLKKIVTSPQRNISGGRPWQQWTMDHLLQ